MIVGFKRHLRPGLMLGLMLSAGFARAQEPAAGAEKVAPPSQQQSDAPVTYVPPVATKGKKAVYAGPTTLVELASTPMLDEEGKQRLDPEGKPMWNPPVRQQRDKKGHPLFNEQGKPVMQTASEPGYDDKGKKLHTKKERPPKTVSVTVSRGTLTVDGMIGKAALNYDIADLKYIYFYAPWVGTVVVSNVMFPGAKEQTKAFEQKTLTVTVDEHTFQLYSDKPLLGNGKNKKPEPAYVLVNRDFQMPSKTPVMGYGVTLRPPFAWPGAKENAAWKGAVAPPPIPASLRPVALLPPCPAGQMRAMGAASLPGQPEAAQPCVAIFAGKVAATVATPPQ